MSIPLDRLYHYIESVAQDVYGDVLIYRFLPHGSKKIEDLTLLKIVDEVTQLTTAELYCNDQEPLNYQLYQDQKPTLNPKLGENEFVCKIFTENNAPTLMRNLRYFPGNIYDLCLLLHSERNSPQVDVYKRMNFIPIYYWSHALISRDWFRYAQHVDFRKHDNTKLFLVYNRAWSGTREYRLKFADLLIEHNLINECQTSIGFTDNNTHYTNYKFINKQWKPNNQLEKHFQENLTTSCYSADFDVEDYKSTNFEIVLETLFQDPRNHLTEKVLRPIACQQPFILAGTPRSLEYLHSYGFKTFDGIIDESYDKIEDHYTRLEAIIEVMKTIKNWTSEERQYKMQQLKTIAIYNQQHFFSDAFFNLVSGELRENLKTGLNTLENTNTSEIYLTIRKKLAGIPKLYNQFFPRGITPLTLEQNIAILSKARKYYNRYLASRK